MCVQDSRGIIWLSTVVFETDAVGMMVREQCPARFPFTLFLVCIMTPASTDFLRRSECGEVGGILSRSISETDKHFVWS